MCRGWRCPAPASPVPSRSLSADPSPSSRQARGCRLQGPAEGLAALPPILQGPDGWQHCLWFLPLWLSYLGRLVKCLLRGAVRGGSEDRVHHVLPACHGHQLSLVLSSLLGTENMWSSLCPSVRPSAGTPGTSVESNQVLVLPGERWDCPTWHDNRPCLPVCWT